MIANIELPLAPGNAAGDDELIIEDVSEGVTSRIPLSSIPHNVFTNLSADSHPQYLNTVRGDGRYSQLDHTHDGSDITEGTIPLNVLPVGTEAGTLCAGDDVRLTAPRTPLDHNHAAGEITEGTLEAARLPVATPFARGGVILAADTLAVIPSSLTLYVSPSGSDTTGDGTSGNPWATPNQALAWLALRWIAPGATVTISCSAGVYNLTSAITFQHPQGRQIQLIGAGAGDGTSGTTLFAFTAGNGLVFYSGGTVSAFRISSTSTSGYGVAVYASNAVAIGRNVAGGKIEVYGFNSSIFLESGSMAQVIGGTFANFAQFGVRAQGSPNLSLRGDVTAGAITFNGNSLAGTVGISALYGSRVFRFPTVNINNCATTTSADANSLIV